MYNAALMLHEFDHHDSSHPTSPTQNAERDRRAGVQEYYNRLEAMKNGHEKAMDLFLFLVTIIIGCAAWEAAQDPSNTILYRSIALLIFGIDAGYAFPITLNKLLNNGKEKSKDKKNKK